MPPLRSPDFNSEELKQFHDDTELILCVLDRNAKMLKMSNSWEDKFQVFEENAGKDSLYDFVHSEAKEDLKNVFMAALENGTSSQHITRFVDDELRTYFVQFNLKTIKDKVYFVGYDVSKSQKEHNAYFEMSKLSKSGAWYHDPVHKETHWSDEVYRIHDLPIGSQIDEKMVIGFFSEPYKTEIKGLIEKLYRDGESYDHAGEIITDKGRKKWIRTIAKPIVHNERVIYVHGATTDQTRFRKYLQKLEDLAETQNLALKGIRSGLFDYNVTQDVIFLSESFRQMLGLNDERSQIPAPQLRELMYEEDRDESMKRFMVGIQSSGNYHYNHFRVKHLNGEIIHYEVHGWMKKNEKGKTTRMIGNLINVHDRVLLQEDALRNMRSLESMVNNGFIFSLLLDKEGNILLADERSKSIIQEEFEVDPTSSRVKYVDVMPDAFKKPFLESFQQVISGEIVRKEVERPLLSGSMQWLDIMHRPILDDSGEVEFILTNLMDITERKKAEMSTKMAEEKARALNRMKSVILSNLSHEIRTPLNGIMGSTDLLLDQTSDPAQIKLLEAQKQSSLRILKQLTDLISLGDIETLREGLNLGKYDLNELVKLTFDMYHHQAKLKGLGFNLSLSKEKPTVKVDKEMLVSAISALVNNAIKYTSKGSIDIEVSELNKEVVCLKVIDTGIGIKKENFTRIFEDFEQESFGLHQKYEGAGIGLSVANKFLELLGAKLDLQSEVSIGSTFVITIPLAK